MSLLYKEISILIKKNNNVISELYSKPIKSTEIKKFFPDIEFTKIKEKKITYNFKPKNGFYKTKKFTLNRLKLFIINYK